ncbi:MAG: DUF2914 domain-containing protein [Deferribacterota bacterium]|nr:DUF2914 domain-containing protein [Deferribacterota bacterium]
MISQRLQLKNKIIFILIFIFIPLIQLFAATEIIDIKIAKDIKDLKPINVGRVFSKDVGGLVCFTEVKTDEYPTSITHLWIYNNNIMAEVPLSVNGKTWKTYSTKNIYPKWTGKWRVEIFDNNGELIDSITFRIVDEKK